MFPKGIKENIYDFIYETVVDDAYGVEQVYTMFNINIPESFKGRSLSISDIIKLDGKYYYCDDMGFKELEYFDETKTVLSRLFVRHISNADERKINILVVEPEKEPFTVCIPNTLKDMQKIVGGYIEAITLSTDDNGRKIVLICNEEGKLKGLKHNRKVTFMYETATILGPFFLVAAENGKEEFENLNEKEIAKYTREFSLEKDFYEYKIPVSWTMCGSYYIKAKSLQEAIEKAYDSKRPLPADANYLEDSFTVDEELAHEYNNEN